MKLGILCHGRHVEALNWELHQFGNAGVGFGQVFKTCLLAYQKRPEVIIFGTGASKKGDMMEADYTIKYMFEHFDELKKYPEFAGIDLLELKEYMKSHSLPENKSRNTREEIANAFAIFAEKGVDEVILVSNPDHIPRCLQMAHEFALDHKLQFSVFATQSDICYDGTFRLTTKIIEMPHRGDDPSPNLAGVIGSYFKVSPEQKKEFTKMAEEYFKKCLLEK